ncbi:MAG: glycoside hydrolase family 3 C-terminal domain-containing protein, partial [Bryobacteraceae bacterium]
MTAFAAASQTTTTGWQLVWSDEFNGPAGTPPDPTKWNYDLGGGGWGNHEFETYTSSTNNAFQDGNGNLVIRAIRDSNGNYTSARLQTGSPGASTHTTDLSWTYGLVEARIKLPFGHGVWPAFWMLGENIGTVSWPACGEVDIMENFGTFGSVNDLSTNNGTAHGPVATGSSSDYGAGGQYKLPLGETVSDDYHIYAIQWSEDSVAFYVDGALYYTATPSVVPSGQWKFNAPFFLLLNLAIGGPSTFLGTPDPSQPFPNQDMLVDYVRVYQPAAITTTTPAINPSGILNAASFLGDIAPGSLVSLFGNNLADNTYQGSQVLDSNNHFLTSVAGVGVSVNNVNAPLTFVSPGQINFQVPWETAPGPAVNVQVTRAGVTGNVEAITIASTAAPSMFLNSYTTGVAWVTGTAAQGCLISQCTVQAGGTYQLWANGLGPKNLPEQDGVGDGATNINDLSVAGGTASCQLTIGGVAATVTYCGAAPGLIIDQLNFTYPAGVPSGAPVQAVLTINGATGIFWLPAPPTAAQLAAQMLGQMTQAQKLQMVAGALGPVTNIFNPPNGAGGYIPGIPALGIPALYFVDGSLGVADGKAPSTVLPSSIASAATWDLGLAYQFGSVIGAETNAWGMNVNLGGNTNMIGREPRDGRTFETKGEDPILAGKVAAAHVKGVQDQHVIGGVKHYAFNDQETGRTESNVLIDDRSGRESDLLAFEIGAKDGGVQSVMCSYNLLNGTWACEDPYLLTQVLKTDWGFPGFVMSDWWALPASGPSSTTVTAANAGLDQEQPDNEFFNATAFGAAIASGQLPQSRVDDMVTRILHAMYQVGVFNQPAAVTALPSAMVAADETVAQTVEEQGAVLLKNANGQLPLNAASLSSIAVIGSHADIGVISGGGSAQVYPTEGAALYEGYPAVPGWSQVVWVPSSPAQWIRAAAPYATVLYNAGTNAAQAAALAKSANVAIVFVSQWTSEGMDMPSLNFTDVIHSTPINQDALVEAVAAANPHTIVVMENGGAQVLPWLGSVNAVLEAWFPGIRGGQAIANILFGSVNPSGKLPVTFPASVNQLPRPVIPGSNSANTPFTTDYTIEGLKVGYKWYDSNNYTPEFPFGFGLSYTTFQFSGVALVNNLTASNPNFQVTFNLTNTGATMGAEVAQVYLALPAGTNEPPKRLVGWQKVWLTPGQQQSVTIEVDRNDSSHPLSYWDTTSGSWLTAPGTYTVY